MTATIDLKGPWNKEENGKRGAWVANSEGEWVALACGDTDESATRHASAIEAVPDLLEALRPFAECAEQIGDTEDPEEWAKFRLLIKNYRAARDAVAKAEGRA